MDLAQLHLRGSNSPGFDGQSPRHCLAPAPSCTDATPVCSQGSDDRPRRVIDDASRVFGSCQSIVEGLQRKLHILLRSTILSDFCKLQVVVFGHGGRDTTCSLLLLEAVAKDRELQDKVRISVYSCSWSNDEWEPIMVAYVRALCNNGAIPEGVFEFNVLKFGEDPQVLVSRISSHLSGKHLVVQCEQGVDIFVEPVSGEWLQDNYEDWIVHSTCMKQADEHNIPCWLIQTNSDLDLCRGVDEQAVNTIVFGGSLQTNAFGRRIEFFKPWPFESRTPQTLIELACAIADARDKRDAFKQFLGLDPANYMKLQNFYAGYMTFSAAQANAQIPIAGLVEVIVTALNGYSDTLPWRISAGSRFPALAPQWLTARFLQPGEVGGGQVRILHEFRAARMDTAPSYGEFLARWMLARRGNRVRRNHIPAHCRHAASWWGQVETAKEVANGVRGTCPEFNLWGDTGDYSVLLGALVLTGESMNFERSLAGSSQPDFTELSPLRIWVAANEIHILDFTCRMLESSQGVAAECDQIVEAFPARDGKPITKDSLGKLLMDSLIQSWEGKT